MTVNNQKNAVVTGVSTGIGQGIAGSLIKNGWHVFGSVRKEKDAVAVKKVLGESFTPLIFDVTDSASIDLAAKHVKNILGGRTLDGLINNAGVQTTGPLRYLPVEDLETVMNVNVTGLLRTCQAFIPMLGGSDEYVGTPGKIVNISSLAGIVSAPFMGPYSASKFAVEALSDAMRVELMPHGIDLIVVQPGAVKTPLFAKTAQQDFGQYHDTEYVESMDRLQKAQQPMANFGLEPSVIGDLVVSIFNKASPSVRYSIMKGKFTRVVLPRLMPRRMLDRMFAKRFGLRVK